MSEVTIQTAAKEETLNIVNEVLLNMIDTVTTAKDFLVTEIPEVVIQLLLWHGVESFLVFFFGVLLVVANLFCIKVWKNIFNYCLEESEPHGSPLLLVPIVIVGLMSIPIFHTITNITWLKIWIAPKLYLLEYTADLVK